MSGKTQKTYGEPFPSTKWSLLSEARQSDVPRRKKALDEFSSRYWKPVYAYVRLRWRRPPQDAMDLTQEFFVRILEEHFLPSAERQRGTFRAFLKACLDNFIRNELRRDKAKSRGGDRKKLAIDFGDDPDQYLIAREQDTPEEILERHWRKTVFDESLARLKQKYSEEGRVAYYRAFEQYDLASNEASRPTYEALADSLGVARTEVEHYLRHSRKRLAETVRTILQEMARGPEELKEEERAFYQARPW